MSLQDCIEDGLGYPVYTKYPPVARTTISQIEDLEKQPSCSQKARILASILKHLSCALLQYFNVSFNCNT